MSWLPKKFIYRLIQHLCPPSSSQITKTSSLPQPILLKGISSIGLLSFSHSYEKKRDVRKTTDKEAEQVDCELFACCTGPLCRDISPEPKLQALAAGLGKHKPGSGEPGVEVDWFRGTRCWGWPIWSWVAHKAVPRSSGRASSGYSNGGIRLETCSSHWRKKSRWGMSGGNEPRRSKIRRATRDGNKPGKEVPWKSTRKSSLMEVESWSTIRCRCRTRSNQDWLPPGWQIQEITRRRGGSAGHVDKVFCNPQNKQKSNEHFSS